MVLINKFDYLSPFEVCAFFVIPIQLLLNNYDSKKPKRPFIFFWQASIKVKGML
jgi:hypothetical protein